MAKKFNEQIDYGNRPERMDPNLERKLGSPENLYAKNPAMKKGSADVQRLVSQRFQKDRSVSWQPRTDFNVRRFPNSSP